jgi:hypothetical protein
MMTRKIRKPTPLDQLEKVVELTELNAVYAR